ncbi:MAG: ABC transporter ATP-binding protein [Rickettsiales bacterium]|nr:ABC transporter ATP-binding protein [Rickettsiales bacterium]|tara:strand:+ start:24854 stop:26170 length:1317 start_codon:yes stop_codon:yes gene_type:complete
MDEENAFHKRLGRYLKVGASASGLAGQYAWGKAFKGNNHDTDFAESLYQFLANMRGPMVKIAQLVAMVPDLLPPAYVEKLQTLQSEAPPMNKLFVRRRMRQELGIDWQTKFKSFNENATSAASLGQVHQATHLDGQPLACKLQYPDMASAVHADLEQLKIFFSLYQKWQPGLDHSNVLEEISSHLLQELDYTQEAKNLELFRTFFENDRFVKIPKVYPDLSTHKLLTMDWQSGYSVRNPPETLDKNLIAKNLFKSWYLPFYKAGILHGDPHTGNYQVSEDHSIILYDFGCVRIFDPSFITSSIMLYKALLTNDKEMECEAYKAWGFENLNTELIETLHLWSSYLYGPLLEDRIRPLEETYSSKKGQKIALEVAKRLRKNGGVKPPKTFVFMDRAAVGLGSVFMHLRAELNWHHLFENIISEVSDQSIFAKQKQLKINP